MGITLPTRAPSASGNRRGRGISLPNVSNVPTVQPVRDPGLTVPAGVFDSGAAEAVDRLGGVAAQGAEAQLAIEDRERQGERDLQVARARSRFLTGKVNLDSAFDEDDDFDTFEERYTAGISESAAAAGNLIQNPQDREMFALSILDDIERGKVQIRDFARTRRRDAGVAGLNSAIASNMTAGLVAKDTETRDTLIANTLVEIEAAVDAGWITEVDGDRLKRQFGEEFGERFLDMRSPQEQVQMLQPYIDDPAARTNTPADLVAPDKRIAVFERATVQVKVEQERAVRVARNRLRSTLDDHLASLQATGVGVPGVHDRAVQLMEPDDFAEFSIAEKAALTYYNSAQAMQTMPPGEIVGLVETARPVPGSPNFATEQQQFDSLQTAAVETMQARNADPATYVQRTVPQVEEAWGRARQDPSALADAIGLSLDMQAEIGVTEGARRAMPKSLATAVVQDIEAAPPSERGAKILALQEQAEGHFPKVLQEMNEAGLDAGSQVLTLIAEDPVASERAAGFLAEGDKVLSQGLEKSAITDLRQTIRDEMQDWARTVQFADPSGGRAPQVNDIMAAVETVAIGIFRDTGDAGEAADFATKLILDRYNVEQTYYTPTEIGGQPINQAKVEQAIFTALQPDSIRRFQPVTGTADPRLAGEPELLQEQWVQAIAKSGVARTLADGSGVMIVVPSVGGGQIEVRDISGNPYIVDFAEASRRPFLPRSMMEEPAAMP